MCSLGGKRLLHSACEWLELLNAVEGKTTAIFFYLFGVWLDGVAVNPHSACEVPYIFREIEGGNYRHFFDMHWNRGGHYREFSMFF